MSKPVEASSKPSCDCQRSCECETCPSVLKKLNPSTHVCNHGTRPKCECDNEPKETGPCMLCSLDEPEPVPDPERTQSIMQVLKYQRGCNCKIVTRAVKADIHRHLGMIDRNQPETQIITPDPTPTLTTTDAIPPS